jgi:hypothetical protein
VKRDARPDQLIAFARCLEERGTVGRLIQNHRRPVLAGARAWPVTGPLRAPDNVSLRQVTHWNARDAECTIRALKLDDTFDPDQGQPIAAMRLVGGAVRFLLTERREAMIRLIAVAFAVTLASSAQAVPLAPLQQPDGITTEVAYGCGAGRTRVGGVCVARTTKRQARRAVRRCAHGVTC